MKANCGKSGNLRFSPTQKAFSLRRAFLFGHLAIKDCEVSAAVQTEEAQPQPGSALDTAGALD